MDFLHELNQRNGATVKDVPAQAFIKALATHLKDSGKLALPDWADLVKTGTLKELSPYDQDWYFTRAASIARRVYLRGGTGVGGLARHYGALNTKGVRRNHFGRAARGVIRHILQQLEEADLVGSKPGRRGRWITQEGQRELDSVARHLEVTKEIHC